MRPFVRARGDNPGAGENNAVPARGMRPDAREMNVEHGSCVRRSDKIAVKPLAIGLLGPEQKKMICETLNLLPSQLIT